MCGGCASVFGSDVQSVFGDYRSVAQEAADV